MKPIDPKLHRRIKSLQHDLIKLAGEFTLSNSREDYAVGVLLMGADALLSLALNEDPSE